VSSPRSLLVFVLTFIIIIIIVNDTPAEYATDYSLQFLAEERKCPKKCESNERHPAVIASDTCEMKGHVGRITLARCPLQLLGLLGYRVGNINLGRFNVHMTIHA